MASNPNNPPTGNSPPRGPMENNAALPIAPANPSASPFIGAGARPPVPNANAPNAQPQVAGAQAQPKAGCCAKKPAADHQQQLTEDQMRYTGFPEMTRALEEKSIIRKPDVGAGLCGRTFVDLGQLKTEKLGAGQRGSAIDATRKNFLSGSEMMKKQEADGIYVDDPEVRAKYTDINVLKLEERLLQRMPKIYDTETKQPVVIDLDEKNPLFSEPAFLHKYKEEYIPSFFQKNGNLELDNDLLDDQMTRPADIAFEKTMAFHTKETNAILQDRSNAYKKNQFKLEITIGEIEMHNMNVFCEEDKKCIGMRQLYIAYLKRQSLGMIPIYRERVEVIQKERQMKLNQEPKAKREEIEFLNKLLAQVQKQLEVEISELGKMAEQIQAKWNDILNYRQNEQGGKRYSNIKQLLTYADRIGDKTEYNFDLDFDLADGATDNAGLQRPEISRRNSAKAVQMYVNLVVNGKIIASTRKVNMEWPKYVLMIHSQFVIQTYTMPHSIQMELVWAGAFNDEVIDRINIEVPGTHVETLTSASSLIQECDFSQVGYEDKLKLEQIKKDNGGVVPPKKKVDLSVFTDPAVRETQRLNIAKAEEKELADLAIRNNADVKGVMHVKAEWKNNGPKMPPIRHEDLFSKPRPPKQRFDYEDQKVEKGLIDVNDPRWDDYMKFIEKNSNSYLKKLFADDAKNALSTVHPFRHMLLIERKNNPELANMFIPMTDGEIIDSTRTTCYLDILEALFRKDAHEKYLRDKMTQPKENEIGSKEEVKNNNQLVDYATHVRRQKIFDKIKKRQKTAQTDGGSGSRVNYRNVVDEFHMLGFNNPLQNLLSGMFVTERKLKPNVKQRETVGFSEKSEVQINLHIIRGENIPLRSDFMAALEGQQGRGNNRQMGGNSMQGNQFGGQGGNQGQGTLMELAQKMSGTPKVESYVEVKVIYDSKTYMIKRTTVDEGQQPKWDQLLSFPFKAPKGGCFTKAMLQSSECVILVSLFDKQIFRHQDEGKIVLQEENRFLGSFEIPIASLLMNQGKMEFPFKVNRPVILPSYVQLKNDALFPANDQFNFNETKERKNEQIPSYINMSVTLDPPISLPTENEECMYPGYEKNELLTDASEWMIALRQNAKYKHRPVSCWGENINGQSVLLCRYLSPTKPPQDLLIDQENGNFAIEKVARFVSLIPFKEDLKKFQDMPDLYCTNQQFLDLGEGDYEEHAILLCNYFNYIDQEYDFSGMTSRKRHDPNPDVKSFLIYGEAVPEGPATYVLRRNVKQGHAEIWCPTTGESYFFKWMQPAKSFLNFSAKPYMTYRVQDPICPLKRVYFVVGSNNIWANTQKSDFPVLMNFNIETNNKAWKPLFRPQDILKYFGNTGAVSYQEENIAYSPKMPAENCTILALKFQKHLCNEFQEERIKTIRKTTRWKPLPEQKLREMLTDFEEYMQLVRRGGTDSLLRQQGRRDKDDGIPADEIVKHYGQMVGQINQVQQINQNKRFWGFPINCTFTNLDDLWEMVKTTRMHAVNRKDIEFCLAVHVEAYPCTVMSVWVYLAAFVDMTTENLSMPQFHQ